MYNRESCRPGSPRPTTGTVPLSVRLSAEADALARAAIGGRSVGLGRYLERLIFEDAVRRETREQAARG
jgi:hypothetical protein